LQRYMIHHDVALAMNTRAGPLVACRGPARFADRCRGARAPRAIARTHGDRPRRRVVIPFLRAGDVGGSVTTRSFAAAASERVATALALCDGGDISRAEDANDAALTRPHSHRPIHEKPGPGVRRFVAFVAVAFAAAAAVGALFPDVAFAAAKSASATAGTAQTTSSGFFASLLDFALHVDARLLTLFNEKGGLAYGALFAVIFCETGLVVAPFLPGDSLLFAAGALGAGNVLNFPFTLCLLFAAAVLGDTVNYAIGSWIGARVIAKYPRVFKPSYVEKTKFFYQTHGGKTVVLARFFVVVRTFAPFVAGVANMHYKKFIAFNVLGGFSWVGSFMTLGYFFGRLPWVEENFALAMMAVVLLSAVPMVVEVAKHFLGGKEDEEGRSVTSTIDDIAGSMDETEDRGVPAG